MIFAQGRKEKYQQGNLQVTGSIARPRDHIAQRDMRKSEVFIVVMKRGNARGAKGHQAKQNARGKPWPYTA